MKQRPKLLIIWHSRTGGSEAMAQAAEMGALEEADVTLRTANDVVTSDLMHTDGILFVCPENLATMSGMMKEFFDRCYYPLMGCIEAKPYATLICAGSDGEGAARQIARIAKGWRLKAVVEPVIICTCAQTAEAIAARKVIAELDLARCRDVGAMMAAGLAMGIF